MFTYFFLAVTLLPGILGCCQPPQFSGMIFIHNINTTIRFALDFTLHKFYSRSMSEDQTYYSVTDFGKNSYYQVHDSGKCEVSTHTSGQAQVGMGIYTKTRCFPSTVKTTQINLGPAGSLPVKIIPVKNGFADEILVMTIDKCLPVMGMSKLNTFTARLVFTNVTDTNPYVKEMNRDFSDCTRFHG